MKQTYPKWLNTIQKMHFLYPAEFMERSSGTTRKWLVRGNTIVCGLTAVAVVLLCLFFGRIRTIRVGFSLGMELPGMLVSALIYYSYMQDPDSEEEHTRLFATLIVANTVGMFLDGCSWLLDGIAPLTLLNRLCNTAQIGNNAGIVFQFWLYSAYWLGIDQEKRRRISKVLGAIFSLFLAAILVNFFFPFIFDVDSDGVFRRLPLYYLIMIPLGSILLPILRSLFHFNGTKREKKSWSYFCCFPLGGRWWQYSCLPERACTAGSCCRSFWQWAW